MKKKSNPMKVFNDASEKRGKALKKAQFGFTKFQGPVTKDTNDKIANEIATQPMPVAQYNTRVLADRDRTSTPYSTMKKGGSVKSKKK